MRQLAAVVFALGTFIEALFPEVTSPECTLTGFAALTWLHDAIWPPTLIAVAPLHVTLYGPASPSYFLRKIDSVNFVVALLSIKVQPVASGALPVASCITIKSMRSPDFTPDGLAMLSSF